MAAATRTATGCAGTCAVVPGVPLDAAGLPPKVDFGVLCTGATGSMTPCCLYPWCILGAGGCWACGTAAGIRRPGALCNLGASSAIAGADDAKCARDGSRDVA